MMRPSVFVASLLLVSAVAAQTGPHATAHSTFQVAHLPSGGSNTVSIYYPEDLSKGPYPLLSFAHGMLAGGVTLRGIYSNLMSTVASWGFIIVAPESCPLVYCNNFFEDQLLAIVEARNATHHEALKHIDTARGVGIFGHSMGGAATIASASRAKGYDIRAAVAMHPVSRDGDGAGSIEVPIMYTTGPLDMQTPAATTRAAFHRTPSRTKSFANLQGANHYEPCNLGQGRLDVYAAHYFRCNLLHDHAACDHVYNGLCHAFSFVECHTLR